MSGKKIKLITVALLRYTCLYICQIMSITHDKYSTSSKGHLLLKILDCSILENRGQVDLEIHCFETVSPIPETQTTSFPFSCTII